MSKKVNAIIIISLLIGGLGLGFGIYSLLNPTEGTTFPEGFSAPIFPESAVYVSPNGVDSPERGSWTAPYGSLQYAITRAAALNASAVVIGQGDYDEVITLADGISLLGGYSDDFQIYSLRYLCAVIRNDTLAWTVHGDSITSTTLLEGLIIYGPNHAATSNSYGIYLSSCDSNLTIRNCIIYGGIAGDGAAGPPASDGADGQNGGPGYNAQNYTGGAHTNNGGAGGSSAVGSQGGPGGTAGTPSYNVQQGSGAPGFGSDGGAGGPGGYGSEFASSSSVYVPSAGPRDGIDGSNGGDGDHGDGGDGATNPDGDVTAGHWHAYSGGNGYVGTHGSGGGGGGAGGGVNDTYLDYWNGHGILGASGGGGGSGGEYGAAGQGGAGGGGSFCIFLHYSTPLIYNNSLYLGRGGAGGQGGSGGGGGQGGHGGTGGNTLGGFPYTNAGTGGNGGEGGDGGDGGGGGGGAGGCSCGIYTYGVGTLTYETQNTIVASYAHAGAGGAGGAPGGGTGNPGSPGIAGFLAVTRYV